MGLLRKIPPRALPDDTLAGDCRPVSGGNRMGISKKGKRTIIYQDKEYVWWVREDGEYGDAPWLTIASPDKSLVLSYRVEGGDFFVISKGRVFQGRETSGKWEYYWYPFGKRTPPLVITPGFVRELVAWAVSGRGAVLISGKKPVLRTLYLLVLCDEELSYGNYKEEFCIGIFSAHEKAEAVAEHYLREVEGFKDYPCNYRIAEKKVFCAGNRENCRPENEGGQNRPCTAADEVYMVYGWDENKEGDEVHMVESDCFMTELSAKQEMVMMKQMYARACWCISRFRVDESNWREGFVRV